MSSEGDTKAESAGSVEGDVMTAPTPEPFDLPPDLLHPDGLTRVDVEALREAMMFAFESGVSGGMFTDALERATLGPSTWDPPSFSKDLFVDDFVARCFRVRTRGGELSMSRSHLVRVLSSPPTEARVVEHRRAIARELGDRPELRRELEQLFTSLVRFRSTLEGATLGKRYDPNRRQLELLALAKEVFDRAANGFSTATSGLSRLHRWGMRVLSGEPYRSLCDLLQYDEELATLSLEVRVGADGSIRRFQIKRVRENEDNPFVMSPIRRWLARVELFFRGYGVSSGEVMARLLGAVFEGLQDELVWFAQLAAECEVYLGALGFRDSVRAMGLEACLPELVSPEAPRVLEGLFNPLLAAHGVRPVPCDLASDRHDTTLLVTGPNSGGKTRLLQAVGITQLLAQSGLFVPCRTARLALVPGLVVSLIQETKADQAEGRLGMELIRIRDLFERLPPGAMVILDELCSGTNPSEGEEIFELVVTLLTELRPQAFVTTHFLTFAERLERGGRVDALRTLQVELGAGERPTYQFVPGVAKTSLAHRAAERLGVTRDELKSLVERNTARAKPSVSAGAKSAQASAKLAAASPARAPEKVS
jgi:DNA mismatch repair protein MutS2